MKNTILLLLFLNATFIFAQNNNSVPDGLLGKWEFRNNSETFTMLLVRGTVNSRISSSSYGGGWIRYVKDGEVLIGDLVEQGSQFGGFNINRKDIGSVLSILAAGPQNPVSFMFYDRVLNQNFKGLLTLNADGKTAQWKMWASEVVLINPTPEERNQTLKHTVPKEMTLIKVE